MADITKCTGENCTKKETCYRYTAISSERQSYFIEPPLSKTGNCIYYWAQKLDKK